MTEADDVCDISFHPKEVTSQALCLYCAFEEFVSEFPRASSSSAYVAFPSFFFPFIFLEEKHFPF